MKIGAIYPQTETGQAASVRAFGLAMEEMGLDHLLAFDHVAGAAHADRDPPLWGPYTEKHPFHDPFVMFAYLAAITKRLEFVTGVLILPQRQTVLVGKQATDLDLLSGQRLRLGVGTGWNYVEYEALGQDFHTRGKRLDEQIELLRSLWRDPLVTFHGQFDHVERANLNIRPERRIPIWIGGFTEPAYRRGARLGDGYIFAGAIDEIAAAWARVQELLEEAGRPVEGFGAELLGFRANDADGIADALKRWRDLGGTHGSILTMGRGFRTIEEHIDFVGDVVRRM
jgi:probable F420-dependent oxidoreductase